MLLKKGFLIFLILQLPIKKHRKEGSDMNGLKEFIYEEDGMGTIEIAVIIAALVGLAIVFRKQLVAIWESIGGQLNTETNDITGGKDGVFHTA